MARKYTGRPQVWPNQQNDGRRNPCYFTMRADDHDQTGLRIGARNDFQINVPPTERVLANELVQLSGRNSRKISNCNLRDG